MSSSFNLINISEEIFFASNTAINVVLFILMLPAMILCGLCVFALLSASAIKWVVRVPLLNIFAAEIVNVVARAFSHLFYLILVYSDEIDGASLCKVQGFQFFTINSAYVSSHCLYAIVVYMFIKDCKRKLTWFIIVYISISWVASISIGTFAAVNANIYSDVGFCGIISSPFFLALTAVVWVILFCSMTAVITFALLTHCYIKKNTLEGSTEIKKAASKNLFFLTVGTIVNSILTIISSIFPLIQMSIASSLSTIAAKLVGRYGLNVLTAILVYSSPVIALIFLKPLRDASKQMCKKMCFCCKTNEVYPFGETMQLANDK